MPIWALGAIAGSRFNGALPGGLPIAALQTFCPALAALILTWREHGAAGAKGLLDRAFDIRRIARPQWLAPIVLFFPLALLIEFGVQALAGSAVADPYVPVWLLPVYAGIFFVAGAGEELGWQGYAYEPLGARFGAARASLLLGVIWALWHVLPLAQAGHDAAWIAWQCGTQVLIRVLIVWIYTRCGGSVFAAIVFHAMSNVAEVAYPNNGSGYDPAILFVILAISAAIVAVERPAFKRWLYRGRRPGALARAINGMYGAVAATGIMPNVMVKLEVAGRKSGKVVSLPLVPADVAGQRYLVSMLGEGAQWVQNVRAADGKAVLVAGSRLAVELMDVPVAERAAIIKHYLQRAPGARPHMAVVKDAPLAAFEAIATSIPVFHVRPA